MQGQSKQIFNSLCEVMQDIDFSYDKKEDELVILSGAQGKDLPMSFMLRVSDERQIVSFVSVIPVEVPQKMLNNVIIALNEINMYLLDGCFAYDTSQSHIVFRSALTYKDAMIGKGALKRMVILSLSRVDTFNGKLQKIVEKEMSVQEIIEFIK